MIRRTLQEWQSLKYGEANDEIPTWAADRLATSARRLKLGKTDGSGIVSLGRHGLSVGQVVGVMTTDGAALEILPKIDGLDEGGLRQRLVHMLSVALGLKIDTSGMSEFGWQQNDLLEILIRLFATKLHEAVRRGMPRSYVGFEEDLPLLRGRLDVVRQFTVHAASPQKLACRFDDLSSDIALNQAMKATVRFLAGYARRSETQRLLRELSFAYADISDVQGGSIQWERILIDRTNWRWAELLELARLLMTRQFQNTSLGSALGFSLLFEMNLLFEEYVTRMLARALAPKGMTVVAQGGLKYCLFEQETGQQAFQTKPDILVRQQGKIRTIIDTKWKRLDPIYRDAKRGITQSDVYQMMAYGEIYNCKELMMLYPHHADLGQEGVLTRYDIGSTGRTLTVAAIDVSKPTGIQGRLGELVRGLEDEPVLTHAVL